jgi:hypothetical protein
VSGRTCDSEHGGAEPEGDGLDVGRLDEALVVPVVRELAGAVAREVDEREAQERGERGDVHHEDDQRHVGGLTDADKVEYCEEE